MATSSIIKDFSRMTRLLNTSPIIFLDIDGVLNHKGTRVGDFIDLKCFGHLIDIITKTGSEVVIISSWRQVWDKEIENNPCVVLKELFAEYKVEVRAVANPASWDRPKDVRDFIEENEISSYIILDDDPYDYSEFGDRWVQPCYWSNGLTQELAEKAISLLLGEMR